MTERQTELARSIESIVGVDHLQGEPAFQIDGSSPKLIARPGSAEEVAACLKVCSESAAAVVPAGRMTWLECGNPLNRADVVLSLERMRRIVQYSPPDLTATVEAGLTLNEFSAVSVRERQWLPLDPPGFKSASLGAIAACNSSGALRLGFGTPRDYVIGLKLAHADGTESKSGGQVVKNVAGYDMDKLYVGSYGTLAIITELTFKLRPLAERISTMMITSKSRGPLFDLARRVLASELQPASVVLSRRLSAKLASNLPDDALLVRFIDSEPAVEHQVDCVTRALDDSYQGTVLTPHEADAVWAEVADLDQQAVRVRLSVPLSAVPAEFEKAFLAHLECVATVDLGAGIIRMAFDADERSAVDLIKRLRSSAAAANGTLVIERAPAEVRRRADAWGDVGSTAALMRTIKARFDPQSLLNPGRFVSGI
ncbi:MAG: FAD-binding oxidoreductase [Acidobacteriota bacterium]